MMGPSQEDVRKQMRLKGAWEKAAKALVKEKPDREVKAFIKATQERLEHIERYLGLIT